MLVENCSQFFVLGGLHSQAPDTLGLKLKPNVSRVLLVNVLNQVPPHFFPLKYFGTYPKKKSYIKNILNYFSGNLFLFNQNIFRKKEESKKGVHLCEEGEEGEGACISLTRTEAIFFS